MSVEAIAAALNHSRATGTAKVVLLGIANHHGDGGAWPSIATLARYANVSERAVQYALAALVESGEVVVHVQDGGPAAMPDFERPNRYDVMVTCPPWCDRSTQHRDTRKAPKVIHSPPVKPASPGEASFTPPVKPASPPPVKPASPEPSIEPASNPVGTEGQYARDPGKRRNALPLNRIAINADACRAAIRETNSD